MKTTFTTALTLLLIIAGISTAAAAPPHSTETISGNTVDVAAGENGSPGWWFDRDQSTTTDYGFSLAEASIGRGSLYVPPIGANPSDKFIAENFVWQPIDGLVSIGYDYLIAGDGTTADADQFYLNVYANYGASPYDKYYDCRYDYTPQDPSDLNDFATAEFLASQSPTNVRGAGCPSTLAGMPEGSFVRMFAISVGDTSVTASDAGLAGYLDNVVLTTMDGSTTYNFDPAADACRGGGWAAGPYRNQGDCISAGQGANAGQ